MNHHADIQFIINTLTAGEKEFVLHQAALLPVSARSRHLQLLLQSPQISFRESAKELALPVRQYEAACKGAYDDLCQILSNNNKVDDADERITKLQSLATILKEKGLLTEALKIIEKAIGIAAQHELGAKEITLQHQYLQTVLYIDPLRQEIAAGSCLQKIGRLHAMQAEIQQLHLISYHLQKLRYEHAQRITDTEQHAVLEVRAQLLTFSAGNLLSNTARIYFHVSALLISYMTGDAENVGETNAALLNCWQEHPHLISTLPDLFVRSAAIQAHTHFMVRDVAAASTHHAGYCELGGKYLHNSWYADRFAVTDFHIMLKVLHKSFRYEELRDYYAARWPAMYKLLPVFIAAEKVDILIAACITCFALQQWMEAESLILEVKEVNRKVKRIDTLYFASVFHCLILFEQKEWSRLSNKINTDYHFLYMNKTLRPFEKDMLLFIKKLPMIMLRGKAKDVLEQFLDRLAGYRTNRIQKMYFAYFDFYSWVESKTHGLSYAAHVRRKARLSPAL